jgi:hypothetical protein
MTQGDAPTVNRLLRASSHRARETTVLFAFLLASTAPFALAAQELPTAPTQEGSTPSRDLSRRHFDSGIRLFEDRNYEGALAEFEAAYRNFPSAASLQNVALCQKQLYRYSEAKETLYRLLSHHQSELTDTEYKAVRNVVDELASLVGSLRITVSPKEARVTLDGRSLGPEERGKAVTLDVGEHRIFAEAEGFAPLTRVFRIAGGHTDVPMDLQLVETTGLVVITAPNPQTAIAIDGRPVAFAHYEGRLQPGRHFIQIYREGYEPYEEEIDVRIGDSLHIEGELGEPTETVSTATSLKTAPTSKRILRGFYGLGSLSLLTVRGSPTGFDASSNYDPGYELGLRAGYRLMTPLAFEAMVSSGAFVIEGRCSKIESFACASSSTSMYHLDTRRIGAGVRFMSEGEGLRLFSVISSGIVAQDFRAYGRHASGSGPYASLELGLTANYRHSLWEIAAIGIFDQAESIRSGGFTPYASRGGIQLLGISVRVGWGDWSPPRKVPPMPATPTATAPIQRPVVAPPLGPTDLPKPPSPQ